jgi:hypothetical protein
MRPSNLPGSLLPKGLSGQPSNLQSVQWLTNLLHHAKYNCLPPIAVMGVSTAESSFTRRTPMHVFLLRDKPFWGIHFVNSLDDFLNKVYSALQGLQRLCLGYWALRVVDKIVPFQPHPVKPGGEILEI